MSFYITNRQPGHCWFLMASMNAKVLIPLHCSQFSSCQLLKGKHTGFLALWVGRGLITILSVQTAVEQDEPCNSQQRPLKMLDQQSPCFHSSCPSQHQIACGKFYKASFIAPGVNSS
ncbi:unnamed protein product [Pipistrellus nathusii]|uniref:Uncharacterized protein n=1 Tax=Pipistrellus nathusii TaxID=59473 RepID=A0ABP0AIZ0_PIPNA